MARKYRVPRSAITERGLKRLIRDAAKGYSSLGEWAKDHDITPQAVSAFFRKTQGAGIKIPNTLGYRPQVVFLPLDEDLIQELPAPRRATDRPSNKVDHTKDPVERSSKSNRTDREEVKKRLKKRKRG